MKKLNKIWWNDKVKERLLNSDIENEYKINENDKVRSQTAIYDYYLEKNKN